MEKKSLCVVQEKEGCAEKTKSAQPFFIDDLIEEILVRVPTKTLFRSKCVCKGWRSLISNSPFIDNFMERAKSLPPLISGFFNKDWEGKLSFIRLDNDLDSDNIVDSNLNFFKNPVFIVASHNGFILCAETNIYEGSVETYLLYNPFLRHSVALPKPRRQHMLFRNALLFCEHNGHNIEFNLFYLVSDNLFNVMEIEIYSSETGEWKESIIPHQHGRFYPETSTAVFNGSVYMWSKLDALLCVYDLMQESVLFTKMPIDTLCFDGFLGSSTESVYYSQSSGTELHVWVLVNGVEWSWKHIIRHEILVDEFPEETSEPARIMWKPLGFYPLDDALVLWNFHHVKYFIYRIKTRRIEPINTLDLYPLREIIPYSFPSWLPCLRKTSS